MIQTFKRMLPRQHHICTHEEVDDILECLITPDFACGTIAKISGNTSMQNRPLMIGTLVDPPTRTGSHSQRDTLKGEQPIRKTKPSLQIFCARTAFRQESGRLECSSGTSASIHTPNTLMMNAISNDSVHPRPSCRIHRPLHCPRRDLRRRAEAARLDFDQGKKYQREPRFAAHPDLVVQYTDGGWAGENFIANYIE
jgi:hypothetical protein